MTLHEDYKTDNEPTGSSNRGFGIVFTAIFLIVAASLAWYGNDWWILFLTLSAIAGAGALFFPERLTSLNRGWTWFALQLAKITTPIILLILFVLCFLPTGLIARMFSKNFLRLQRTSASSYWIARDGRSAEQTNMKNQF